MKHKDKFKPSVFYFQNESGMLCCVLSAGYRLLPVLVDARLPCFLRRQRYPNPHTTKTIFNLRYLSSLIPPNLPIHGEDYLNFLQLTSHKAINLILFWSLILAHPKSSGIHPPCFQCSGWCIVHLLYPHNKTSCVTSSIFTPVVVSGPSYSGHFLSSQEYLSSFY